VRSPELTPDAAQEHGTILLDEAIRRPQDELHWGPKFMAHVREELRLNLIEATDAL